MISNSSGVIWSLFWRGISFVPTKTLGGYNASEVSLSTKTLVGKLSFLTVRTIVSGSTTLDDALDLRSAADARFAFAFVHAPEPFRSFEITSVAVGQIDPQRRPRVNRLTQ